MNIGRFHTYPGRNRINREMEYIPERNDSIESIESMDEDIC